MINDTDLYRIITNYTETEIEKTHNNHYKNIIIHKTHETKNLKWIQFQFFIERPEKISSVSKQATKQQTRDERQLEKTRKLWTNKLNNDKNDGKN